MTDAAEAGPANRGERKLVTMLFADLAGYTALAETMDPEEVYGFLRPTMAALQAVVESFGGSVPQIQGDGFMAVFGVPTAHEDDAERAVRAGLAVRDHVRTLNARDPATTLPEVHAGVHSGEVMVAPSTEAAGFTVIGDTVNTASRIAGLAVAGQVLVSAATRALTERSIAYGPARRRRAKGKASPIATSDALGPVAHTAPPSTRGTFVDREEMFGLLGRELELTERHGRSRVLAVVGEPGIGKSRLAMELGHSLPPGRFLVGRCVPFGDRPPFAALGDAVAQAIGLSPGANAESMRAAVEATVRRIGGGPTTAALAADLRTLLGAEPADEVRSDRDAVRAARLVLEHLAGEGTVAVVIDDLHWADRSLRDLLGELHREPWPASVFVLGLSRERMRGIPTATLSGLDRPSMRQLAAAMLGDEGSGEAAMVPVARANGNALFLEEMLGMLVETGAVRHAEGGWHVVDPAALREVPTTIRLLIAARLDALPPDEKQVLFDAAVCGAIAWDELLVAMCHVHDVRASIDGLLARDLLRATSDATVTGATAYGWKHALIRDVAYDAIPRAVRAERHLEIAGWLRTTAARGREPVGAIGVHYERAWELTRRGSDVTVARDAGLLAATYITRSAEQMFRRQARAAEPLYRRALRAADDVGDDVTTARAAVGLAEVLIEMGAHAEAIEQATTARRLAERADDAHLAALAMLALGRSESDAGRMRRARTVLQDAHDRFEAEGDLRGQGWALHRLSETWGWADFERELGDLRAAYALFARARDRFGREVVAHDLAYILSVEGGPEFRRWYRQAERLTEDEGDLRAQALLLRTWGGYVYAAGRYSEAADVMARCRPLAVEAGDRYAEADALVIGALARVNVDDPSAVDELVRDAMALGRELGSTRTPTLAKMAAARAAVRQGRPDVGARQIRAARDVVRTRRIKVMYGDVAEATAMFALDRGAWTAAIAGSKELAVALRAVPMSLWNPVPALIRGRALLGAGRAAEAVAALDEAVRAARSAGAGGALDLARVYRVQAGLLAGVRAGPVPAGIDERGEAELAAVLAETTGVAALRRGEVGEALDAFDTAVDRWHAFGSTSWLARASALRAEALRASGDRARAAASSGRARATADRIGMPKAERAAVEHPLPG